MSKDHIRLLADLAELCEYYLQSGSLTEFLDRVVVLVAKHLKADVCSIYLYEEARETLTLTASHGLKLDRERPITLKLGEGIAGRVMQVKKAITEKEGPLNPHFKAVPGIEEEKFEAYLVVPILMGENRMGVVMLQRGKKKYFVERDLLALRALTSQLAYLIENARLHISAHGDPMGVVKEAEPEPIRPEGLRLISGKAASEGNVFGETLLLEEKTTTEFAEDLLALGDSQKWDFEEALDITIHQIENLRKSMEKEVMDDSLYIFNGHLLILKDKSYVQSIRDLIEAGTHPAEAILQVGNRFTQAFSRSQSQLVREKVHDLEDIGKRLIKNLLKSDNGEISVKKKVVVARTMYPSELIRMASEKAAGIILVSGGVTSHVAILARSVRLPLMIADDVRLLRIPDGSQVLMDTENGKIYFDPDPELVALRTKKKSKPFSVFSKTPEAETQDGVKMELMVNVNLLSDVKHGQECHADGIGLYRSEFSFMFRDAMPGEEEQYEIYRRLFHEMGGKPVTLRTLDLGGDKLAHYYGHEVEENPALGLRSVRLTLRHRELFVTQLRAMLRAGVGADLRIMFPMIAGLEDWIESREIVSQCLEELRSEALDHQESPKLGIMVEIPSVITVLDDLARQVDFLSIGTNDLIQYLLAVDRTNSKVAEYYLPHHPAVLRSLHRIMQIAERHNRSVSICGDMAHNPHFVSFFLGIGVRSLSLDADYIEKIRDKVRTLKISHAEKEAQEILQLSSVREIAYKLGLDYVPIGST